LQNRQVRRWTATLLDTLIASWFLAGAPPFLRRRLAAIRAAGA
jgi:hypothetical protein